MTFLTRPFFTLVFAIADIAPLVIALDLVGILLILFKERMDPRTFILWLMIIIVFPIGGFILYLLLGCTLYSRRLFSHKREAEEHMFDGESYGVPEKMIGGVRAVRESGGDVYTSGNDTRLMWSMDDSVRSLIADIGAAERSVHMEVRAIPKGDVGRSIVDALAASAEAGRDVRLMTDVYGFGRTRGVRALKKAGGSFRTFHNRLYSAFNIKNRNRDMRYITVIDGRISYIGMDASVRIEGPAADRLERRFLADWAHPLRKVPEAPDSPAAPVGADGVQIVSGGPDLGQDLEPLSASYAECISNAKERVMVSMPYMIPDETLYNSLKLARLSGAEVTILLPERARHWYQPWNSLAASSQLMMAGVRVFFTRSRTHRCVITSDGMVTSIGSAVFCQASMSGDMNTNAVVFSERVAAAVEERFSDELKSAVECSSEDYRGRTFADRLTVAVARMMMFFN